MNVWLQRLGILIMHMGNFVVVTLFFCLFFHRVPSLKENPKVTYEELYKTGVTAYLENQWYECIAFLEKALADYFYYKEAIVKCRKACRLKASESFQFQAEDLFHDRDLDLLPFYTVLVKNALCLMKCQREELGDRPKTSKDVDNDFESRVPYDYLQLCYFKVDHYEKAASCAYTFLIHNPGHEVMQNNLRYYMDLPDLEVNKVKYLETKNYQELYLKATQMYAEKNYETVIDLMEEAIIHYLKAEEECRLLCEGPMSETPPTEFIIALANHFTFMVRCKLKCPETLSYIHGQKHDNLFLSHYHYLQFSYYKTKRLKQSCEAVASYLLMQPDDEVMHENYVFYSNLPGVMPEWFSARKEVVQYHKQIQEERNILKFIEETFQFDVNSTTSKPQVMNHPIPPPGATHLDNNLNNNSSRRVLRKRDKRQSEEATLWEQAEGIVVVMRDKDLNGSYRVTADGLASEEECGKLVEMASDGAIHGDGYNGKHSPHTEFEMFEGLTVGRAAALAQKGALDPVAALLFLNISEKIRHYVEIYFNLEWELYFAYTHLVCRTALPDSPGKRTDLSHPVHADNCVLTSNGECLKQQPAYTWRDYSAILYLNEDFDGGEFIFAKDKETVQAAVKPKCGRMVAFSAGKENLHGVKAVKKGRRCALAMWYTLDPKHKERERDFAEHVLKDLIRKQGILQDHKQNLLPPQKLPLQGNRLDDAVSTLNSDTIVNKLDLNEKGTHSNDHRHNDL